MNAVLCDECVGWYCNISRDGEDDIHTNIIIIGKTPADRMDACCWAIHLEPIGLIVREMSGSGTIVEVRN